ncbi:MAG: IS1595 family transposase [Acidimicrobiales bacterium]|jgi:transposase-like protein
MEKTTIASLSREISTEAEAYAYLESLRWGGYPTCAHCGSEAVSYMTPKNGTSRKTRTGSLSERRVWQCRDCRKQFSVTTGTVMDRTKISVRTWVMVFFELCASKNGVAAREIERKYGLCPRTAWHMTQRIRAAMANNNGGLFSGIVEADEMYVGKRQRGKGSGMIDKLPVVTLVERGGRARSTIPVSGSAIEALPIVVDGVKPGTAVVTDSSALYSDLHHYVAKHETVNHSAKEWGRGVWHTNTVEGFFGMFRRSVSGTHHFVTNKHVARYLAEHDFRYSTRRATDSDRMAALLRQVEGPLRYKTLTGRR